MSWPLWALVILFLLEAGCVGGRTINEIGTIPETKVVCHSVKDEDLVISVGMIVCVEGGKVQAAAGGASAGSLPAAGAVAAGLGGAVSGILGGK